MKRALIIGSSGGIGQALCAALQDREWQLETLSRRAHGFDVTDAAAVDQALSALSGPFDLVVVATGALVIDGQGPEKSIKSVTADGLAAQFATNAIGPALILRHAARLLPKRAPATFGILSARVGSIGDNGLGGWTSYRAAKAALNQIIKTTSIELARTHPQATVLALHPGTVQTEFTKAFLGRHPSVPPQEAAENLLRVMTQKTPSDSGGFFDYSGAPVPW